MALTVDRRSSDGETTGTLELDESIFGIQPNVPVLHQVVTAQLAAARAGTQSTKTRAEVSGGGRKPFKQKGTGRARQGSERAPHFTGGGVALGPKPRSYRQKTPRKMIQLALRSALSDRAADDKIVVVDSWPWEVPSTKDAKAAIAALGITGRALVVLSREDEEAYKSFRNLTDVQVILQGELNAYDILCNDWIVFTPETLPGGVTDSDSSAAPEGRTADVSAVSATSETDLAGEAEEEQTTAASADRDEGDAEDVEPEGVEDVDSEPEDGDDGEEAGDE
jgi:large subunit ribosomal protein L4